MKDIDPPKTRSLAVRSTTDGLTKKQRQRQERLAKHQAQQAEAISISVEPPKMDLSKIYNGETRMRKFAQGLGIRKIEINREKNSIEFELEPEFESVLQTISSWKKIDPHTYLSQLLMEYFMTVQNKQKLN